MGYIESCFIITLEIEFSQGCHSCHKMITTASVNRIFIPVKIIYCLDITSEGILKVQLLI